MEDRVNFQRVVNTMHVQQDAQKHQKRVDEGEKRVVKNKEFAEEQKM